MKRAIVDAFALARGAKQPITSKQEAENVWEPKFIGEIVALGLLPVGALERAETIEDFKSEYGKTRSIAAVNRPLGHPAHVINWGRGRTPAIIVASPSIGSASRSTETKRDRRIAPDEERRLLEAAEAAQLRRTRVRRCADA